MSMIGADTKLGRTKSVISRVWSEGWPLNMEVIQAEVTLKENEHPSASLFVASGERRTDFTNLPSQRIEFDYGYPGNSGRFQGYINTITPQAKISGTRTVTTEEVSCLGPSLVYKGGQPRFYTDLTATEFMRRIVAAGSLGFSDEYHSDETAWRQLAQTSESDWQMIVNMAKRIGASVVVSRGVVRLLNYQEIMSRQLPSRQYVRMANLPLVQQRSTPPNGLIIDFTPTSATDADPMYSQSTVSYMATDGVHVLSAASPSGRFAMQSYATGMPAHSVEEAETIQAGYYIPPWVQEAQVRVMGDATIEPGCTVSLSTSPVGKNVVSANYDGIWYVKEVFHQVNAQRYYTVLTVGRVGERVRNYRAERPFWLGDKRGVPFLRPAGDGRWLSSWRETVA